MLAIRFQRQGRKNHAFFRVVLTESSRPAKSGFLKILGWYNPHTKETSLNKEEITKWLDQGAQASNSVAKLFVNNKIEHKNAKFTQDTPKKAKKSDKKEEKKAPAKAEAENEEAEQAGSEATQEEAADEVTNKETEETPAEAETPATEEIN